MAAQQTTTTTKINTTPDPTQQKAYAGLEGQVNYLQSTQEKQLDPEQLKRRIGLASATAADAAAGQIAAGNQRAAQLGRPELAGVLARKANSAAAAAMSRSGQEITAEELAKLDAVNEARRNAVTEAMIARENASRYPSQFGLQAAGLTAQQIAADRAYQLQQEDMRQRAQQFNAGLAAQRQQQQAQMDFARQQALAQMALMGSGGGGTGGGATPAPSSGGYGLNTLHRGVTL